DPGLQKDVEQVVPGHHEQGQAGGQAKADHVRYLTARFQKLPFELRIARLQEDGNVLVEDGPDDADAQKAEAYDERFTIAKVLHQAESLLKVRFAAWRRRLLEQCWAGAGNE